VKNSSLSLLIFFFAPIFARALGNETALTGHLKNVCAQTTNLGPARMTNVDSRFVSAINILEAGKIIIHLSLLSDSGAVNVYDIPFFNYKNILLIGNSVWFLTDSQIKEYSLVDRKIVASYSTFPTPFNLTTRARGFAFQGNELFIAHGELGVSVFNLSTRKYTGVLMPEMRPGTMAGAVQIKNKTAYILLGAYLPIGFNGIASVDLNSLSVKYTEYPEGSGVIDAYSSNLQITDKLLLIKNGGWIHAFDLAALASGAQKIAPRWISISERIESEGEIFDKYLMVEGDLVVNDGRALACSSITYTRKGQRLPVREWRVIDRGI
jgi:hypothetical protein